MLIIYDKYSFVFGMCAGFKVDLMFSQEKETEKTGKKPRK